MAHKSDQIDEAIAALSSAVAAGEQRSERLQKQLSALTRKRQAYLSRTVEDLMLPAINTKVLRLLREEVPRFVTDFVEQAFAENRKFLGIFETAGYSRALFLLHAQLSSYLDRNQHGDLVAIDAEIYALKEEMAATGAKVVQSQELIKLLQEAVQSNALLPPQVSIEVGRIIQRSQEGTSRFAGRRHAASSGGYPNSRAHCQDRDAVSSSSDDDDFDILFYLVTDIPTSFRTMLLSAVSDHRHHHDESVNSSSNSLDDSSWRDSSSRPAEGTNTHVSTGYSAQSDSIGAAAAYIATDDSLGRFS
ncbi:hypothetical protein LPN04_29690 [Rugamonas sp. A1-17]|nr:hypothetical protein [Rugamonas sp. A1-17]